MGVDIIQNCEVKGIKRNGDEVEGVDGVVEVIADEGVDP